MDDGNRRFGRQGAASQFIPPNWYCKYTIYNRQVKCEIVFLYAQIRPYYHLNTKYYDKLAFILFFISLP